MSDIDTTPATSNEIKNTETDDIKTADQTSIAENTTRFFPVSEGKLITLYIVSFGMYAIYWFYKNWTLQQEIMEEKIRPFWRAIFSIFYTHSLFRRIHQQASNLEKIHQFNANVYATLFVAAIIISNIIDRLTMNSNMFESGSQNSLAIISLVLFFVSIYPLVKVQATVNRINNDMLGFLNHKYSLWNYLLIALGSIVWVLLGIGMLNGSLMS